MSAFYDAVASGDKWEKEVKAGMGSRKATQPPKKHKAIYDDVKGLVMLLRDCYSPLSVIVVFVQSIVSVAFHALDQN